LWIFSIIITFLIIFSMLKNDSNIHIKNEIYYDRINSAIENTITEQWINNPTFESPIEPIWYWENGTEGDNSDMDAIVTPGQANYRILGDEQTFTVIYGTINSSTSPGWKQFNKEGFLLPDTAQIRSYGCFVYHYWYDDPNQFPAVHWKKNISLPIDMSDYVITSASLEVVVNATVSSNVDTPNDNGSWENFAIGDSVTFYTQISDLGYNSPIYTVASNKTKYLGQQNASVPTILSYSDYQLETVNEIDLITSLNSAFEKDPDHSNFTLTLGVDIYSEDNLQVSDPDTFDELIIKTCNLTFSVRKKIDQFTRLSWNQIGNNITGDNIQIVDANFNFEYKINNSWPIAAPLSEIRFYINNKIYNEGIIKISTANATFEEAKPGGFNVLGYIEKDVNISVSIEVFLKDNFELNESIDISIDNVYLNITYIETLPDLETNLQLFLNGQNKTDNPLLELPIGEILNITVKFSNSTGDHLSGADILITGEKVYDNITEDVGLDQYSILLNSTERMNMGVNLLTIKAKFPDHQTEIINPRITVRKIYGELTLVSGNNIININPGESTSLQLMLNNTDYGGVITDAIITYSSTFGDGILTDQDNNGIYEVNIQDIPLGSHSITISAYIGDNYLVNDYLITINVIVPSNPLMNLLIYILIGVIATVSVSFILYQKHFKFPRIVRKIKKLKKKVRKGKKLKEVIAQTRKEIIDKINPKYTQSIPIELYTRDINELKIETGRSKK